MNPLITIKGNVIDGKKRGKDFGFPTANLKPEITLPEGVFVSETIVAKNVYKSVTFIGAARTFNESDIIVETYIIDFSQDIYGLEIEVNLLKKIRDNVRFNNKEDLIAQMKKDEAETVRFFN